MTSRPGVELLEVDAGESLRLHVERSGGGPALLLLHGFTGSAATWGPLRAALGGEWTTLAVDLPGHGRSDAPDDAARYALPRVAAALAEALRVLDVERAAVLGYSLGARTALHFALRHPACVAGLVLESGSPGVGDPAARAARLASDAALADAIERDGIEAFVDRWERLPLWASQGALSPDARASLRAQRMAGCPRGLANSLRGAGAGVDPIPIEQLAAQTRPALLVAGALDHTYAALGRAMAAAMPRARFATVPDAGHAVHLEQPATLAGLVGEFLRDLLAADGRWR
jgi:2-succinyl-6-hydroxy-2,4-cyclohexadiene-1-carboxylate synthase